MTGEIDGSLLKNWCIALKIACMHAELVTLNWGLQPCSLNGIWHRWFTTEKLFGLLYLPACVSAPKSKQEQTKFVPMQCT